MEQLLPKSKQQILVTGGTGLIGKALQLEFAKDKKFQELYGPVVFLSSKEADLTNNEEAIRVFKQYKPVYVINLAAKVGGLYANMNDNDTFYNENLKINENVLSCSNEIKVKKCISCLSTCIFPAKIEYPLDETKIHLGPPHDSNKGYSLAKRRVDLLNKHYNKLNENSLFTAIIPTNIYGQDDNFNLEQAHVIPSLIHKGYLSAKQAISNQSTEAQLQVCGSGKPLRQFVYAKDLAKIILWLIENYTDREPLILCPDETDEVSIGDVVNKIATIYSRKFNIKIIVKFDTNQSDGQFKKTANNQKFRNLCPDFHFTPIETGLEEVIDWFIKNYPNVRR